MQLGAQPCPSDQEDDPMPPATELSCAVSCAALQLQTLTKPSQREPAQAVMAAGSGAGAASLGSSSSASAPAGSMAAADGGNASTAPLVPSRLGNMSMSWYCVAQTPPVMDSLNNTSHQVRCPCSCTASSQIAPPRCPDAPLQRRGTGGHLRGAIQQQSSTCIGKSSCGRMRVD